MIVAKQGAIHCMAFFVLLWPVCFHTALQLETRNTMKEVASWPKVFGMVSEKRAIETDYEGESEPRYSLLYRYQAEGNEYNSTRPAVDYSLGNFTVDDSIPIELFEKYSEGDRIKVWHHPDYPDIAVFSTSVAEITTDDLVAFGLVFGLLAFLPIKVYGLCKSEYSKAVEKDIKSGAAFQKHPVVWILHLAQVVITLVFLTIPLLIPIMGLPWVLHVMTPNWLVTEIAGTLIFILYFCSIWGIGLLAQSIEKTNNNALLEDEVEPTADEGSPT